MSIVVGIAPSLISTGIVLLDSGKPELEKV